MGYSQAVGWLRIYYPKPGKEVVIAEDAQAAAEAGSLNLANLFELRQSNEEVVDMDVQPKSNAGAPSPWSTPFQTTL